MYKLGLFLLALLTPHFFVFITPADAMVLTEIINSLSALVILIALITVGVVYTNDEIELYVKDIINKFKR